MLTANGAKFYLPIVLASMLMLSFAYSTGHCGETLSIKGMMQQSQATTKSMRKDIDNNPTVIPKSQYSIDREIHSKQNCYEVKTLDTSLTDDPWGRYGATKHRFTCLDPQSYVAGDIFYDIKSHEFNRKKTLAEAVAEEARKQNCKCYFKGK